MASPVVTGARLEDLRTVTRALNLHVPPSYFGQPVRTMPYEEAIAPLLGPDDGAPLHLYVGVPLCVERCRFCMYFYGLADAEGQEAEACLRGLEQFLAALPATRPIAGCYIGGGTPSVLSAAQVRRLMAAIGSAFTFEDGAQRTFEMSPGTTTPGTVRAAVDGGFDRVSFGVQSFDPAVVAATGRTYTSPDQVHALLEACRAAGVEEVNADLMVGLDGETDDSLADSVALLLDAGCPTVSIYRYRPARAAELDRRGGLDAHVSRCAERVKRAASVAEGCGRDIQGRPDGEHIRLVAPGSPPWAERNLYETRFRPQLRNSLVGVGVGARSFHRDTRLVHCAHDRKLGWDLVGRPVEVEDCDVRSRVSAALVNEFFREFTADAVAVEATAGAAPEEWFGAELAHLVDAGVLQQQERVYTVTPAWRAEWVYLDKLLYPPDWLERRRGSVRLRER